LAAGTGRTAGLRGWQAAAGSAPSLSGRRGGDGGRSVLLRSLAQACGRTLARIRRRCGTGRLARFRGRPRVDSGRSHVAVQELFQGFEDRGKSLWSGCSKRQSFGRRSRYGQRGGRLQDRRETRHAVRFCRSETNLGQRVFKRLAIRARQNHGRGSRLRQNHGAAQNPRHFAHRLLAMGFERFGEGGANGPVVAS
jgi:hypothetical protein